MAFTCIPAEQAKAFREALKTGKITLADLVTKSSEARLALLEKYTAGNAKAINLLIEEKLVLKNKLQGLKNAVSKIGQIGRYDPVKKAALDKALSDWRTQQQERIFSPAEEQTFLKSLAEKIVGTEVTRTQAKTIFDFQQRADGLLARSFDKTAEKWTNKKDEVAYGYEMAGMEAFTEGLKGDLAPLRELLGARFNEFRQKYQENKLEAVANLVSDVVSLTRDTTVAALSTVDNSFQFRQGFSTLVNKPSIWKKGFSNSWVDLGKTLKGKDAAVKLAINARTYARPNYILGRDKIAGLINKREEAFPTSLLGRLPLGVGRLVLGAENSFVGSAKIMREGLFDNFLEMQKLGGADVSNPLVIQSAGKLALQMTARSKLGKAGSILLNHYLFWAPRIIKSSWDTLTLPVSLSKEVTPFVRKQSALNLLRLVAVIGATKAVANALLPGSVTIDPRSTDFKNIKIGNTRISFGIGEMSLITLASRLVPTTHNGEWGFWSINSQGIYQKFDGKYGEKTPFDIALQFLEGKATPFPARLLIDLLQQRTFAGSKPTLATEAGSLLTPISIQNAIQLKDDASAAAVLGVIADTLGFSSNTYSTVKADWTQNPGVELQQFRQKVGDIKFKEANNEYNQQVDAWLARIKKDPVYKALSDVDKQREITQGKTAIKDSIYKEYGFKYQKAPTKKLPKLP